MQKKDEGKKKCMEATRLMSCLSDSSQKIEDKLTLIYFESPTHQPKEKENKKEVDEGQTRKKGLRGKEH